MIDVKGIVNCSSWQSFWDTAHSFVSFGPRTTKIGMIGKLKFYSLFWVSSAIWDHFLTKYSKVGSKIKVRQNENPSNPICMNPKAPYIPILVVLGPKLWAVSQKLCQPEQLNMPFLLGSQTDKKNIYSCQFLSFQQHVLGYNKFFIR